MKPLTTREVAERLGVTPRRVRALATGRTDFPKPLDIATHAMLFDADEIEEWAATADRRPGYRPPTE